MRIEPYSFAHAHTQNLTFVENDEEDSFKTFGFAMEKSEKLCYQIYSGTI